MSHLRRDKTRRITRGYLPGAKWRAAPVRSALRLNLQCRGDFAGENERKRETRMRQLPSLSFILCTLNVGALWRRHPPPPRQPASCRRSGQGGRLPLLGAVAVLSKHLLHRRQRPRVPGACPRQQAHVGSERDAAGGRELLPRHGGRVCQGRR